MLIQKLQCLNADLKQKNHGIRINNVIDIYNNETTVLILKENEYHKFNDFKSSLNFITHFLKNNFTHINNKIELDRYITNSISEQEYFLWQNDNKLTKDYLYFLECAGAVKIGKTQNIEKRLNNLRTGLPQEYKLKLIVEGKGHLETALHNIFKEFQTKGGSEWFTLNDRLIKFIHWINSNTEYNYTPSIKIKKKLSKRFLIIEEIATLFNLDYEIKNNSVKFKRNTLSVYFSLNSKIYTIYNKNNKYISEYDNLKETCLELFNKTNIEIKENLV